jgi:hypothetical protein
MSIRSANIARCACLLLTLLAVLSVPLTAHAAAPVNAHAAGSVNAHAAGSVNAHAAASADEQNTMAVWKQQRIDFYYRSATAIYSCSALQKRIEAILYSVGAGDDLRVDTSGCNPMLSPPAQTMPSIPGRQTRNDDMFRTRPSHGEQYAHVRILVKTPVEATPEVMAALKKDKPRRELLGKVTGKPEAAIEEETQFPAQREQITLSRDSIGLEAAECELLDQLANSVFVDLNVRVVSRDYSCSPGHTSRIPPQITVDALMPAIRVREPEIHPGAGNTDAPADTEPNKEGEPQTDQGDAATPAQSPDK